jgi:hypothetical protein
LRCLKSWTFSPRPLLVWKSAFVILVLVRNQIFVECIIDFVSGLCLDVRSNNPPRPAGVSMLSRYPNTWLYT